MSKFFKPLKPSIISFIILILPIYSIIDSKTLNNIFLQEHNKYRYIHNSKKLSLDSKIIKDATVYAESLATNSDEYYLEPSGSYYNSDEKYGENLFQCNKKSCKNENISLVTTIWYDESSKLPDMSTLASAEVCGDSRCLKVVFENVGTMSQVLS